MQTKIIFTIAASLAAVMAAPAAWNEPQGPTFTCTSQGGTPECCTNGVLDLTSCGLANILSGIASCNAGSAAACCQQDGATGVINACVPVAIGL